MSAISAVLNRPNGGRSTFELHNQGQNTTLKIAQYNGGSSSSSSSSCGTGEWRRRPVILSDNDSNVAIFIEGTSASAVMAVHLSPGGCSVSSSSMSYDTFRQRYPGYTQLQAQ